MYCGCEADYSPVPLTPDYGGPVVSYADGVFDTRFGRYITVREGIYKFFFFFSELICAWVLHSYQMFALVISLNTSAYGTCRSS